MIRSYQGHTPIYPTSCYIDTSAQLIGDVTLGEHSSVWMNAVLRGDVHSIRIGSGSNIQDCAVLHGMRYKYPVIVGDSVTIGHNATVHGCVVEDTCLIGIGAIISQQCPHQRRLHHRRGRPRSRGHSCSATYPLGGSSSKAAAGTRRPGSPGYLDVCP